MQDLLVWKRIYRQEIKSWSIGKEEYSQVRKSSLGQREFFRECGKCKYIWEIDISNFVIIRSVITLVLRMQNCKTLPTVKRSVSGRVKLEKLIKCYGKFPFSVLNRLDIRLFTYFDSWTFTCSSSRKRIDEK